MTNMKLHTRFRLVPELTTLDDLQRPVSKCMRFRCPSRPGCSPMATFCRCKAYVVIRGGPLERGVKRQWGRERRFLVISDATSLEPLEMSPTLLYSII